MRRACHCHVQIHPVQVEFHAEIEFWSSVRPTTCCGCRRIRGRGHVDVEDERRLGHEGGCRNVSSGEEISWSTCYNGVNNEGYQVGENLTGLLLFLVCCAEGLETIICEFLKEWK